MTQPDQCVSGTCASDNISDHVRIISISSYVFRIMQFSCNVSTDNEPDFDDIDDIIIHSRILAEHVRHVRAILADIRQETLYAQRNKCSFAQTETDICGLLLVRLES